MSTKFIKLFNSIYDTSYKTVSGIFDAESKKRIDEAFNALAVSEGLRDVGIMSNHFRGYDGSAFGLHVGTAPGFRNATFIGNKHTISEAAFNKLLHDYNEQMTVKRLEIVDAPVTKVMSKRLGYLFPYPKNKADGVLRTILHVPGKTEFMSHGYGPQMLTFNGRLGNTIRGLQDKWNKLAAAVHEDFRIEFRLEVF
jgi:hypothetical protein